MSSPGTIVVACTANICRSPMAAALLQHALRAEAEPLRSLKVVSAAVGGRGGDLVSENSVIALKKVGLDIAGHRSRPVTQAMLDGALAVIGMTEMHRAVILMQGAPAPEHVFLFREFMPGPVDREIADPYGGPLKAYEAARDEMVEAIPSLVARLKTLIAAKPA